VSPILFFAAVAAMADEWIESLPERRPREARRRRSIDPPYTLFGRRRRKVRVVDVDWFVRLTNPRTPIEEAFP
jgi:hypothetical protein